MAADGLAVLLLIATACHQASIRLSDWRGPAGSLSNDLYIPAIMLASGKGFINVDANDVPGLQEFLQFQKPVFRLPPGQQVHPIPLHPFQRYHRYLVTWIGAAWWVARVSWPVMKMLLFGLLALLGLLVYALFRVAMGPVLSFLGAWLVLGSPSTLNILFNIRDYSKAPFFLATLLLLAYLMRRPSTTRRYWAIAVALGAIQGIGLGFRRDLMICAVPNVAILLMCRLDETRRLLLRRLAAVALMGIAFVSSAWPILVSFHEEGTLGSHDTIMGLATKCEEEMGLPEASYERLYILHDMFASFASHEYGERVCHEKDILKSEKQYLAAIWKTFPADMLTRAFAAVSRILQCPTPHLHIPGLSIAGLACALAGTIILAALDTRQAVALLFLVLYFCGYTSLQYDFRHSFHLTFVPFWFIFFTLNAILCGAIACTKRSNSALNGPASSSPAFPKPANAPPATHTPLPGFGKTGLLEAGPPLKRAILFVLAAAVVLLSPLLAARLYQRHTVGDLVEAYGRTPMEHLESHPHPSGDAVLFEPERTFETKTAAGKPGDLHTDLMMVEIEAGPDNHSFEITYGDDAGLSSFSRLIEFRPPESPGVVGYYFPVYEYRYGDTWNRFLGVTLPKDRAASFKGVYRAKSLDGLGLLVNMAIPQNMRQFRYWQELEIPANDFIWGTRKEALDPTRDERAFQAHGLVMQGAKDEALKLYGELLQQYPGGMQYALCRARILNELGRKEEARAAFGQAVVAHPGDPIPLYERDMAK